MFPGWWVLWQTVAMMLDQRLIDAAVALMDRRRPGTGHAVAAAVYLDDGEILTSIGLDNLNAAANLCAETGALCRAYTRDRQVTASVCVSRDADSGGISILAPCGICQERLALWGPDVEVAVADPDTPSGWSVRTLVQVNPYYWGAHFADKGLWPSQAIHGQ